MGVVQGQLPLLVEIIRPGPPDQLGHGAAALPQGGGHAVAGGVAGADDHHVQSRGGGDGSLLLAELGPLHGRFQIFRAVAHAADTGRVEAQGAGDTGAAAQQNRVILLQQPPGGLGFRGIHAADKADALVGHQIDPPLNHGFGQLHVGDAVGQKSAGMLRTLHHGDGVSPVIELPGLPGRSPPRRPSSRTTGAVGGA